MSKYFSFLRKKRALSQQEDHVGGGKGKRKDGTKKPSSSSSSMKTVDEENRFSLHSLDLFDNSKEDDPFHSDNDSVLDNVSFGEVALEGDSEKKIEDDVQTNAKSSSPSDKIKKRNVEEDEGHVVDGNEDDERDEDIDDFMEEAFNDLEDEEKGPKGVREEGTTDTLESPDGEDAKEVSSLSEIVAYTSDEVSVAEDAVSDQDFVTIVPVNFGAETLHQTDQKGTYLNIEDAKHNHSKNIKYDSEEISNEDAITNKTGKNTFSFPEELKLTKEIMSSNSIDEDRLDVDEVPAETPSPCRDVSEIATDVSSEEDALTDKTSKKGFSAPGSSNMSKEITSANTVDEDRLGDIDEVAADISGEDSLTDKIGKNTFSVPGTSNMAEEIISVHTVDEHGRGDVDEIAAEVGENANLTDVQIENEESSACEENGLITLKTAAIEPEIVPSSSLEKPQEDPSSKEVQHSEDSSGRESPEYRETEANSRDLVTETEPSELVPKCDSMTLSDAEGCPDEFPFGEDGISPAAASEKGEPQPDREDSSSSENSPKNEDEGEEPNVSSEYQDMEAKLELSSNDKEIKVQCTTAKTETDNGCESILRSVDNDMATEKPEYVEDPCTPLINVKKELQCEEETGPLSDNDGIEDAFTKSDSSSIQFLSCERPSICPSDLEEDEFDSAKEDLSDEEKQEAEEKSPSETSMKEKERKDYALPLIHVTGYEKPPESLETEDSEKMTSKDGAIVKASRSKSESSATSDDDKGSSFTEPEPSSYPGHETNEVSLTEETKLAFKLGSDSSVPLLEHKESLKTAEQVDSSDKQISLQELVGNSEVSNFSHNEKNTNSLGFQVCDTEKSEISSHKGKADPDNDGLMKETLPNPIVTGQMSSVSLEICDEAKVSNSSKIKNNHFSRDKTFTSESILSGVCREVSVSSKTVVESSQTDFLSRKKSNGVEPQQLDDSSEDLGGCISLYESLETTLKRKDSASRSRTPIAALGDNSDQGEAVTRRMHSTSEDEFLIHAVNSDRLKAEARLAQRRAARAEARELRLRELERQQQEQDNNEEEEQYSTANSSFSPSEVPSRTPSAPRTRSSVPASSISRRSSEDSTPDDGLPASRELKADLKELDEKFRKAMITNAQLDNEKATLTFEVEFLKDKYSELEENHIQLTKEHRKKCSENEQLRKLSNKLKEEVKTVRRVLQERDELIQEYGLVLIGEESGDDSYEDIDDPERRDDTINDLSPRRIAIKKALLSHEASELLSKGAAKGSLDVRLRKYAEDKNDLEDEVRRLKMELEEELSRRRKENGIDHEKQKEASKSLNEYKFRVQKAEAEVSTLQANVARLESLVARYKASTEQLEQSEEELKSEKRRLQRESRDLKEKCDELETSKAYVKRQYEKLLHDRGRL